jgi:hypothetical protein
MDDKMSLILAEVQGIVGGTVVIVPPGTLLRDTQMDHEAEIEQKIQASGATKNRLTPDDISNAIKKW